jgi:hypothetical protein
MRARKKWRRIGVGVICLVMLSLVVLCWDHVFGWRRGFEVAARGWEDEVFPWYGAETPRLVITEYLDYDCPYCITGHRKLRRLISGHLDEVRLVRLNYARMPCVPNDSTLRLGTCELVRASICASRFVDFWEWNDVLIRIPRTGPLQGEYVETMRDRFAFPQEEFDRCLLEPETIAIAQKIYETVRDRGVRAVPVYTVDGNPVSLSDVASFIDAL